MNIKCNLCQLEVGGIKNQPKKLLSPDVEIKWENGYYATLGRTHHGLQTDCKNYDEIMKKCSEISIKMFELYDILNKEDKMHIRKFKIKHCRNCNEICEKGITQSSDCIRCNDRNIIERKN